MSSEQGLVEVCAALVAGSAEFVGDAGTDERGHGLILGSQRLFVIGYQHETEDRCAPRQKTEDLTLCFGFPLHRPRSGERGYGACSLAKETP